MYNSYLQYINFVVRLNILTTNNDIENKIIIFSLEIEKLACFLTMEPYSFLFMLWHRLNPFHEPGNETYYVPLRIYSTGSMKLQIASG